MRDKNEKVKENLTL